MRASRRHLGTSLLITILGSGFSLTDLKFTDYVLPLPHVFSVCKISNDIVLKLIQSLPLSKASGLDDISAKLLEEAGPIVSASLTYINAIYPSELELKETTLTSNEVCYLDTRIKTGDSNTPFHLSVYDKRDDFSFRIVNFPYIDSDILANPAYSVYISQLVRYARICTSKLDFIHRLR